ncbi:hypothetical protein AX774_g1123 [Zancudomyces culisetae]|uniref:Uncharacterized protein n=1 Tax=Zancudomyces culisetae TaxID=1213189 RepID=A0A1R1PWL4_ZANCU|nr:hypothetical protein AX774_g1123 [Zancudomyces culisetae]|eukprot:OMH85317.1 hypothetical protein AX774_g1123 [Zancudomyces culisetae]
MGTSNVYSSNTLGALGHTRNFGTEQHTSATQQIHGLQQHMTRHISSSSMDATQYNFLDQNQQHIKKTHSLQKMENSINRTEAVFDNIAKTKTISNTVFKNSKNSGINNINSKANNTGRGFFLASNDLNTIFSVGGQRKPEQSLTVSNTDIYTTITNTGSKLSDRQLDTIVEQNRDDNNKHESINSCSETDIRIGELENYEKLLSKAIQCQVGLGELSANGTNDEIFSLKGASFIETIDKDMLKRAQMHEDPNVQSGILKAALDKISEISHQTSSREQIVHNQSDFKDNSMNAESKNLCKNSVDDATEQRKRKNEYLEKDESGQNRLLESLYKSEKEKNTYQQYGVSEKELGGNNELVFGNVGSGKRKNITDADKGIQNTHKNDIQEKSHADTNVFSFENFVSDTKKQKLDSQENKKKPNNTDSGYYNLADLQLSYGLTGLESHQNVSCAGQMDNIFAKNSSIQSIDSVNAVNGLLPLATPELTPGMQPNYTFLLSHQIDNLCKGSVDPSRNPLTKPTAFLSIDNDSVDANLNNMDSQNCNSNILGGVGKKFDVPIENIVGNTEYVFEKNIGLLGQNSYTTSGDPNTKIAAARNALSSGNLGNTKNICQLLTPENESGNVSFPSQFAFNYQTPSHPLIFDKK